MLLIFSDLIFQDEFSLNPASRIDFFKAWLSQQVCNDGLFFT